MDDLYGDLLGDDVIDAEGGGASVATDSRRAVQLQLEAAQKQAEHYKTLSEKLHKKCVMLEKNLSCLFKTAWSHLRRKDGHLERLKEELKETRRRAAAGLPLIVVKHEDSSNPLSPSNPRSVRQATPISAQARVKHELSSGRVDDSMRGRRERRCEQDSPCQDGKDSSSRRRDRNREPESPCRNGKEALSRRRGDMEQDCPRRHKAPLSRNRERGEEKDSPGRNGKESLSRREGGEEPGSPCCKGKEPLSRRRERCIEHDSPFRNAKELLSRRRENSIEQDSLCREGKKSLSKRRDRGRDGDSPCRNGKELPSQRRERGRDQASPCRFADEHFKKRSSGYSPSRPRSRGLQPGYRDCEVQRRDRDRDCDRDRDYDQY